MIIVCGEALVDCLPATCDGRSGFVPHAGGSSLNVARALARLDAVTAFLGRLSTDPFGDLLADSLAADGVGLSLAPRVDEPSALAFVHLDDAGVASYSFHVAGSAAATLTVDELPLPLPAEVTAVHTGSLAVLLEPGRDAVRQLLAHAHAAGRLTSLDPNVRPAFVPDVTGYRQDLVQLLADTDVVKTSEEDLAWLAPGEEPVSVVRGWLSDGPALAVLTRGADGAVAVTTKTAVAVPAPAVSVVDTVGAGDTFSAALLAWLEEQGALSRAAVAGLDDAALAAALTFAARAAAMACAKEGADPPHRDELRQ